MGTVAVAALVHSGEPFFEILLWLCPEGGTVSKMDIEIVKIKAGLIEDRKNYEDMGYDTRHAFLLPFKLEPRFRTLVEILKEFTDNSDGGKLFDICPELNLELKQLCSCLVFLVNSASYRKGIKYYGFDKMEVDLKLGRK